MNGLDSKNHLFYQLLTRAKEILASLKAMDKAGHFDPQKMSDLYDELAETLAQMTNIVAGWNKKP